MTLHHRNQPVCELCESKLTTAHPRLADWFRRMKSVYSNAHVSWAYRGQADQDKAFREGKTRARFPKSPHNHTENGQPCSLALDLFLLDEKGVAVFPPKFYAQLSARNEEAQEDIAWGGHFKSIGDADHFQLETEQVLASS